MGKFFSKDQSQDDGLSSQCKECCSLYRKQLREIHKERELKEFKNRIELFKDFSVSFD
jgi:hypothetical protein